MEVMILQYASDGEPTGGGGNGTHNAAGAELGSCVCAPFPPASDTPGGTDSLSNPSWDLAVKLGGETDEMEGCVSVCHLFVCAKGRKALSVCLVRFSA